MGLNRRIFLTSIAVGFLHVTASAGQDPSGLPATADKSGPRPIVLDRVTVVNVSGDGPALLPDRTVVVADRRIKEVIEPGRPVSVPGGATRIRADGMYLGPGFWDAHAHCAYEQALPLFLAKGVVGIVVMAANPAKLTIIGPRGERLVDFPGVDGVDHVQLRGQTDNDPRKGPRIVLGGQIIGGRRPVLSGVVKGRLPLRQLLIALPPLPRAGLWIKSKRKRIDDNDNIEVTLHPQIHSAASPAVVAKNRAWADEIEGSHFFKAYGDLDPATFEAILWADPRTKQVKRQVAAHVPFSVGVWQALDLWRMEHGLGLKLACSSRRVQLLKARADALATVPEGKGGDPVRTMRKLLEDQRHEIAATYDAGQADRLFTQIAKHQAENESWICPTLAVRRALAERHDADFKRDPRRQYLPPLVTALWDSPDSEEEMALFQDMYKDGAGANGGDESLLLPMHRKGVKFLCGTDEGAANVFPGFSLHEELRTMVAQGLPPLAALQAATINVAKCLGLDHRLGTVDVGKEADLVLLEANPLECISNTEKIHAVIRQGELLKKEDLADLLDAAARGANPAPADQPKPVAPRVPR